MTNNQEFVLNNQKNISKRFPNYDWKMIKFILNESNKLIADKILKGDEFLVPQNMGVICVAKLKNKRVFDYIHWCKTGEKIPNHNLQTLGYIYKTLWISGNNYAKKKGLIHRIYKFTPNRWFFKRPLAKMIKSGIDNFKDKEYIERFYNKSKIII